MNDRNMSQRNVDTRTIVLGCCVCVDWIGLLFTICRRSFISVTTSAEPRVEDDKDSAFRRHLGTEGLIWLSES